MIKPKGLKPGSVIGIVAPASPVEEEKVIGSKKILESMGFQVKMGKSCYEKYGYLSGKDRVRAYDLNNMFADEYIDGIICLRGGYGSVRILEMIDYNSISKNPKVFVGYSDITALHIAINQRANLITFHGPMAASNMTTKLDDFTYNSFVDMIGDNDFYGEIKNPLKEKLETLSGGRCMGKITGGNMAIICSTLGTPYEIDTKNKILFLEDIGEEPYRVDRMLNQLHLAGKLEDCLGIILGDFKDCNASDPKNSLELEEVFNDLLIPLEKPILGNVRVGHCMPMITLPLGAESIIDATRKKIFINEKVTT
ncbi:S66 peptidase family protein [Anaeromicrobium sediminis]|uniref:LD-carboxypeptidase n=1 Tax=Anaeromicrobium sediminis TaxID=1478221 RepID=A0A267MKI0_9FIRM|nr:LD-carboxypeptidase [Anaeromicrobium sediminis]PAB59300.1 LD-carboxypeptidase [Anaeromicrobium sediminis]